MATLYLRVSPIILDEYSEADLMHGANGGVNPRQGGTGFGLETLQGGGILWGSRAGPRPYGWL